MDLKLLNTLCSIHSPSGDEGKIHQFLLDYINKNAKSWKVKPTIISGEGWQNNIVLVFGKPKTAIFAHIDSIGFTVRYEDQLVPIGSPQVEDGFKLVGEDALGPIDCELFVAEDHRVGYNFPRVIQRGTTLTWKPNFRVKGDLVSSGYMDNRLGVFSALKVAETLENGIIVFSTWEEHGGGSVPYLIKYCVEEHGVRQALVADITWVTDGVFPGEGVVVSMRDKNLPRKAFIDRIVALAEKSGVPFQIEVEGSGSSDGREIQQAPYAVDWCFIGAPEDEVHSPNETVHLADIKAMIELYQFLMKEL